MIKPPFPWERRFFRITTASGGYTVHIRFMHIVRIFVQIFGRIVN